MTATLPNFTLPRSDRKITALTFVRAKPDAFRPDFADWLVLNWHVWLAFEQEADRVWERGRRHYSARTIGEYLRHETLVRDAAGAFKVNDHWWPDLARLYVMHHPDRDGFFELRTPTKTNQRAA